MPTCFQVLQDVFTYVTGAGELQVQLADYIAAPRQQCAVELIRERVASSAPAHAQRKQVSLSSSIGAALADEVVVEFPRFSVNLNR